MSFYVILTGVPASDVERAIADEFAIVAPTAREDVVLIAQAQARAVADLLVGGADKVNITVSGHDNGTSGRVPGWTANTLLVSVAQVYAD